MQSGSSQSAPAGTAPTNPFVVMVVDHTGAALVGVPVTFVVTSGGGTVSAARVTTDAGGLATVNHTAGNTVGTSVVTATVAGLTPVTFSTTVGIANALTLVSGSAQTGTTGAALANPFVVRVTNSAGTVLAGVPVTFAITSGGGTLSSTTATSGANGLASTTYTAGATAGNATVTATIAGGGTVTFTASAVAPVNVITIVSGNSQTGTVNTAYASPYTVKVADASGNAVSGATVTWSIATGGGTLSATTGTTSATGQASTTYTHGATAGSSTVIATIAGGGSVTFTSTAATVNVLTLVSGNNQTGPVSTALATPFTVKVADASGNAVTGAAVMWAITSGGGSLSSASSTTTATGQASTTYTPGATAGTSTITATIAGGGTVTFTSTAALANVLTVVSGNNQSAAINTALALPLTVKVADASGNAVSGATVTWSIVSGGGVLSTATATTSATGLATTTYTTGATAGAASVRATIAGGGTVTFAVTATP